MFQQRWLISKATGLLIHQTPRQGKECVELWMLEIKAKKNITRYVNPSSLDVPPICTQPTGKSPPFPYHRACTMCVGQFRHQVMTITADFVLEVTLILIFEL